MEHTGSPQPTVHRGTSLKPWPGSGLGRAWPGKENGTDMGGTKKIPYFPVYMLPKVYNLSKTLYCDCDLSKILYETRLGREPQNGRKHRTKAERAL